MKKSSKIFGSLAVSAALVMGTAVPAFADTTSDPNVDTNMNGKTGAQTGLTQDADKSKGTGETTVNISTYTSQISVTVPLSIQFALDTNGGAGYAPTNYKIANGTVVPVKVTQAVITPDAAGKYGFGTTASTATGAAKVSTGTIGDVYADFTPKPATGSTATTHLFLEKDKGTQTLDWVIGAKPSGATATPATYTWEGNTYQESDFATFKAAVTSSSKSYAGTMQYVTDWTNALSACNGDLVKNEGENGATNLEFGIAASSSVLSGAEALTNNAAKVVYTVQVA